MGCQRGSRKLELEQVPVVPNECRGAYGGVVEPQTVEVSGADVPQAHRVRLSR